jgi:hypothetical protein
MATSYKVLGQSAPSADTDTNIYTVPAATQAICSTLVVCNTSQTTTKYNIAIRPAGETLAQKHYISYQSEAPAQSSTYITIGASLSATDVVTIRSNSSGLSFTIFGSEIS